MGLLERHVALARLQERVNSAERQQMQRQQRAAAEASPAPSSARIAERADQETGPREAGLDAPAFDCHLLISDQRGHVVRCRCMRSTSLRRLLGSYCKRRGLHASAVLLARFTPDDTAEKLGLSNGDLINVVVSYSP